MRVVLASKNKHKLEEISKITALFDMELVLQSELGVDIDVEENGTTFEENSFIKAEAVMKATGLPALADDSGIAVDALNGEPGIYSARYGFDESLDDWACARRSAPGPVRLRHYHGHPRGQDHPGPGRDPRRAAPRPCG